MTVRAAASLGLWWGTAEGVALPELIDVAAETGYGAISVTPSMYFEAVAGGHNDADLRARLDDAGVVVAVVDPLIRGLPGCPQPNEVGPRFRSTFEHGEDDCYQVAEALRAPALNLAHFLCTSTPLDQMIDVVGGICERAARRQVAILVEFMPEGSIPDFATAADIVARVGAGRCAVMLDTWHFFRTSGTLEQLRNLAPGTIGAVQVSDAAADMWATGVKPPTRDRLVPGDGVIPLREILSLAMANCPEVVVGAEVFSRSLAAEPPMDRARRVRAGLDAVWP
jgi:sugar phosphate isomerase/epimerase